MSADSDSKKFPRLFVRFLVVGFGFLILLVACGLAYLYISGTPPKESKLIAYFYQHRNAYERLHEMVQEDKQTVSVAGWGVETTTSGIPYSVPPDGNFPVARYHEYLGLLKEVNASNIFRSDGLNSSNIRIDVWGSGFGGDTRHIHLAWLEQPPANQIFSLDDYYKTRQPPHPVYRHIEGNWYLWADW